MSFLSKMFQKKPVSTNQNFKLLNSIYTGQAQQGVQGSNYLSALLTGQGDTEAANAGLENYYQQAGYEPALRQMQQGIVGGGAASGLLRSGSTAKALTKYGAELNQGFYNNYLSNLGGLANIGNQGGQLLANAGGGSAQSMGPSTAGIIGKLVGGGLSLFGSDRRLKQDIVEIGTYPNGLPMYEFTYKSGGERFRGVMSDDVRRKFPDAVVMVNGFDHVYYDMLGINMERVDAAV